jgi:NAD(P)H-hydrate epimerase
MSLSDSSPFSHKDIRQQEAIDIDLELFNEYQFSVDQLMELAGLSVAAVIESEYKVDQFKRVVICCGPGNNGGDGLVAGRHLKLFGYEPLVVYPKRGRGDLFDRLTHQVQENGITVVAELPADLDSKYDLIVDAVFGFSYKPPLRPQFQSMLSQMSKSSKKIVCIDIPSGWHVENGPPNDSETPVLRPDCLISLTAPKLCARLCDPSVKQFVGGRFVPEKLDQKYGLNVGALFPQSSCFVRLSSSS